VAGNCKVAVIRGRVAAKKYENSYRGSESEVNVSSGRAQENKF
jgi:hypothetical protein